MMRFRYSGRKTKATPRGDHRRVKPYLVAERHGYRWTRIHEVWENGRWEGFANYSPVYKTKAQAMKNRPEW